MPVSCPGGCLSFKLIGGLFSTLLSLLFLWYRHGEFFWQPEASWIGDHFLYFHVLYIWFKGYTVRWNWRPVTPREKKGQTNLIWQIFMVYQWSYCISITLSILFIFQVWEETLLNYKTQAMHTKIIQLTCATILKWCWLEICKYHKEEIKLSNYV